jgi:hypothetical protein
MEVMCLVFLNKKNPLQFVKGFLYRSRSISRILYTDNDKSHQYPYHLSTLTVTSKL